jgi:nucleotide-binding universal stress UspA family protein
MKILLAIDDSKYSEAATDVLVQQIRRETSEVYDLHVVVPLMLIPYGYMGRVETLPEAQQEKLKEAKELVEQTAQKVQAAGFKVQTGIEEGDPKDAVIEKAAQCKTDVIFVGSHGRQGIDRFLIGSTSQAVLHHAPCSVAIVRIPAPKAS